MNLVLVALSVNLVLTVFLVSPAVQVHKAYLVLLVQKGQKVKLVTNVRTVRKDQLDLKDLQVQMVSLGHPVPGVFLVMTDPMVKMDLKVILAEMVNRVNLVYLA